MVFILFLLLLAAILGILGAVLKAVAFLVLTAVLTTIALAALAGWWIRRQLRRAQQTLDRRVVDGRSPSADPGSLPPSHDDRY